MIPEADSITLETSAGAIQAHYVVNTAGGNAAEIESLLMPQNLLIKPRKGQYYIFDKQKTNPLKHVIYQAQETDEGGTLIAPTIDGNLIAGPTSEDVRRYSDVETTQKGLAHVERVAKKIIPSLDMNQVIANLPYYS